MMTKHKTSPYVVVSVDALSGCHCRAPAGGQLILTADKSSIGPRNSCYQAGQPRWIPRYNGARTSGPPAPFSITLVAFRLPPSSPPRSLLRKVKYTAPLVSWTSSLPGHCRTTLALVTYRTSLPATFTTELCHGVGICNRSHDDMRLPSAESDSTARTVVGSKS